MVAEGDPKILPPDPRVPLTGAQGNVGAQGRNPVSRRADALLHQHKPQITPLKSGEFC